MLHETDLPKFLWAEATAHAVYLKNRTWTRTIGDTTPFEILNGQKPNIANLQPWGCKVRVHDTTSSKLDGRSSVGRWMGFDAETRDGHRIYWPERRTVSVERSVKFNFEQEEVVVGVLPLEGERKPVKRLTINAKHDVKNQGPNQASIDVENLVEDPVPEAKPAEGRGQRIQRETEYVRLLKEGSGVTGSRGGGVLPRGMKPSTSSVGGDGDGTDHTTAVDCEEVDYAMVAVVESAEDLQPTYEEAHKRPNWPKWQEAIQKELKSLEKMGTYQLVKWAPGGNIVDSRWVFRIKKNAAGEIDKYKASLVAKGFTQIYGVNYYETYVPIARLTSFRLLLALAAQNGWAVDNFDFDSAYLNSKLLYKQ